MAISQAMATSFKVGILDGDFNFGAGTTQTYKIALYTSTATLGAATTAYTTSNEVVGSGYSAGGKVLTISQVPTSSGTTAFLDFDDVTWTTATITARGALIYLANGTTNPAVGMHAYVENTVVDISATPAEGFHFTGWTGDTADPESATTTVLMDADKEMTANFEANDTEAPYLTNVLPTPGSASVPKNAPIYFKAMDDDKGEENDGRSGSQREGGMDKSKDDKCPDEQRGKPRELAVYARRAEDQALHYKREGDAQDQENHHSGHHIVGDAGR